jgi:hypothetical protein
VPARVGEDEPPPSWDPVPTPPAGILMPFNIVGHYLLMLCTLKLLFIMNQLLKKTLNSESTCVYILALFGGVSLKRQIRCFLTC